MLLVYIANQRQFANETEHPLAHVHTTHTYSLWDAQFAHHPHNKTTGNNETPSFYWLARPWSSSTTQHCNFCLLGHVNIKETLLVAPPVAPHSNCAGNPLLLVILLSNSR